jgi:hypothetical protein
MKIEAYIAGQTAAKDGRELWHNPYCFLTNSAVEVNGVMVSETIVSEDFKTWSAGWCFGMQEVKRAANEN